MNAAEVTFGCFGRGALGAGEWWGACWPLRSAVALLRPEFRGGHYVAPGCRSASPSATQPRHHSGLELRGGVPVGAPLPFAVSLSVRRGAWGVLNGANRRASEERLRLELYPYLADWGTAHVHLITTAGLSSGRRYHPVLGTSSSDQEGFLPDFEAGVLRDEWRAEGSAGVELRAQRVFWSFVFLPYVVAHGGTATGVCDQCLPFQVSRYQASFGAALFLTFGVSFTRRE